MKHQNLVIALIWSCLSALVLADSEAVKTLDNISIGVTVVSFALSGVPVLGQALMLVDGLVAFAALLGHLFSNRRIRSPCNCECDKIRRYSAGRVRHLLPNTKCLEGQLSAAENGFQSTKSQIHSISSQIDSLATSASRDFQSKVGAIKSTISKQQLVQPFYTVNLNLPGAYRTMFADITSSQRMVSEYLTLSQAVKHMVKDMDGIITTAELAKKEVQTDGFNGSPVSSVVNDRVKDAQTLLQAAQKALEYSQQYNSLVKQRISSIQQSLKTIDANIAEAKSLSEKDGSTLKSKQAISVLKMANKPGDYQFLASKFALVNTIKSRTGNLAAAEAQVFGKDNVKDVEEAISFMQADNVQRAMESLKKSKKLDTTSQQQLKMALAGLESSNGRATDLMRRNAFSIVFGAKGVAIQKQSAFGIY